MALVELHRCNMCGKTCENRYATKSWIWFSAPVEIKKSLGKMDIVTNSYTATGPVSKKADDFCSIGCLEDWINLDPNSEGAKRAFGS